MEKTMEKIVALAKSRGFVYPGSEIYGGLANTWDYGNIGVELKNNVKRAWWQKFIQEKSLQCGSGLRDPDEFPDLGRFRTISEASAIRSWTASAVRSGSARTS